MGDVVWKGGEEREEVRLWTRSIYGVFRMVIQRKEGGKDGSESLSDLPAFSYLLPRRWQWRVDNKSRLYGAVSLVVGRGFRGLFLGWKMEVEDGGRWEVEG